MDRTTKSRQIGPKIGLIVTTALASVVLTGAPTAAAPSAEASFSKAQRYLEAGKAEKAITHAEAAVLAEPRNPGFRAMLGAAYLEAGRFEAAATSFNDALDLGDTDPRTTLSYALATIALGDSNSAIAALDDRRAKINAADYGLAIALAGKPKRAIHVLTNALRNGQNSAKMRQNLAYTYALAGNWRAARVMAAEDVPADQLDKRLTGWAKDSRPEDVMKRVANLLGVSPTSGGQPARLALANFPDPTVMVAQAAPKVEVPVNTIAAPIRVVRPSQSESLAFRVDSDVTADSGATSIAPSATDAVRVAGAKVANKVAPTKVAVAAPVAGPRFVSNPVVQKLPGRSAPVAKTATARVENNVQKAGGLKVIDPTVASNVRVAGAKTANVAAPAAVAASNKAPSSRLASRFVSQPVVQKLPPQAPKAASPRRVADASSQRRMAVPKKAPARVASSDQSANSHLVQLGSYSTREDAKNGWAALQRKFSDLKGHDVVITKAKVKGKIYYRVAAAGFGPRSARSLCGTVKSSGRGCFAYAASSPPKGAIDSGVRIAARTR